VNAAVATAPVVRPRGLAQLVDELRGYEARNQEDVVAPLSAMSMSDEGTVVVPGRGELHLNSWSRSQFSALLGLRWDRWFAEASPAERSEEVNRRLRRARGSVRVRSSTGDDGAVIRAVLSPTYEAVPDSTIAATLLRVLGDLRVTRSAVTDMSTSFVIEVGEPLKKGGIVGTLHGGLVVRNSDVGYAALAVVAHLTRLICSNGMIAPLPDAEIVRIRHAHLNLARIEARINEGVVSLPAGLRRAGEIVARSTNQSIDDVDGEIRRVLREAHLLRRHERSVIAAYAREPHASAFGISQAITLAAQEFPAEQRFDLEQAAGSYLSLGV